MALAIFWVIAILNGALISLAQPGRQGPAGKGHFPTNSLETISSALSKCIIFSLAPSWGAELNFLLCSGEKKKKTQHSNREEI